MLWIDGEPVSGDLLDADEARGVYREIVSTLKDPALLEWVDHQLLQLSVYPIPPGGTRKVEIEYIELLAPTAASSPIGIRSEPNWRETPGSSIWQSP